jgi:hypothetical protein
MWTGIYVYSCSRVASVTLGPGILRRPMICLGMNFLSPHQRFNMLVKGRVTACKHPDPRSVNRDTTTAARAKITRHIISPPIKALPTTYTHKVGLTMKRPSIAQRKLTPSSPFQNNSKHASQTSQFRIVGLQRATHRPSFPVSPACNHVHHGHRSRHPPAHRV